MGKRIRAAIGAAAVGLGTTAAGAADVYPVRLSVPCHVGDTRVVTVKVKRTLSQTWVAGGGGRKPAGYRFEAVLAGTETVDAVSPNGRPAKLTVAVDRCTKDGVDVLPAGTTVAAHDDSGRTAITVNGIAPTDDLRLVLDQLIYAARPDEPTADDEFGTGQPRQVGDSWPADGQKLAQATRLPFRLTGQDCAGQATLTAVAPAGGTPTQTVHLTEHCAFDSRPGRDGATYKGLTMDRDWTMTVPTGSGPRAGGDTGTFTIAYTVVGPAGTEQVRAVETTERTYADRHK